MCYSFSINGRNISDMESRVKGKKISFHQLRVPSSFGSVEIEWRKEGHVHLVTALRLLGGRTDTAGAYPEPLSVPWPIVVLEGRIRKLLEGAETGIALEVLDLALLYPFQKRVLLGALGIPRGMTLSYGDLAKKIGAPGAARAVGTALARNPFPLVLPCHRVIRSTGEVGNFGGGSAMKEELLRREGVLFDCMGRVDPSCRLEAEAPVC